MPSSITRSGALAAFLALALAGCEPIRNPMTASAATSVAASAPTSMAPTAPAGLPNFSAIADRYGPAVVNISATRAEKTAGLPDGLQDHPLFRFFFRGLPSRPEQPMPLHGVGSGFIVGADGYILSNAHVVKDATEVQVKLTDRREFKAKVIGTDPRTDVALLKIDAGGLPTVAIGNPDSLKVGDWVLAIGSPFGFENSVTAGIVSAKSRSLPGDGYVPFIQTDVAVNPGNSGGPLFNMAGQVVGINSQIYSRSGGYMGLSFAIPIDVALNVKDQLQAHGKVTRGRLGVAIQEVTQGLANSFGLPKPQGALVSAVENGGPADKAGVRAGDVILKLNGKPVAGSGELPVEVASLKPGSAATLEVWRDGKPVSLEVTVGELKEEKVASADQPGTGAAAGRLGLAVRPLTPAEERSARVEGGVMVEDVSGPARRAGIQPGDVILAVNGEKVGSPEELRKAAEKSGKTVALLVQRGQERIYLPVVVG
jgi:serine protease Do